MRAATTGTHRRQAVARRGDSEQTAAEPRPRRPAQLPCTTATGVPQTATHGGGPSAASLGTAWADSLSWSRPAAWAGLVMPPAWASDGTPGGHRGPLIGPPGSGRL